MNAIPSLKKGACYLVRYGHLYITDVPWVPTIPPFQPTIRHGVNINLSVQDLWFLNTKLWNEQMVRSFFIKEHADKVIELHVPNQGEDELV